MIVLGYWNRPIFNPILLKYLLDIILCIGNAAGSIIVKSKMDFGQRSVIAIEIGIANEIVTSVIRTEDAFSIMQNCV